MLSLELAREEVMHLVRKPIMVVAFVVMMVIPLLYGALYLWAFWDPYGSLDRIPVAVVNLDAAAKADDETITAGADLVDELLEKNTFDWRVVSAEEAARGVHDGTYYSSLTIPEDFSATLAAADSDAPVQARLKVVMHESTNMIAAQIEGKVFGEVRKAASASAAKDYFDSVLLGFDDIREGLSEAADGSAELADGLDVAADGSVQLEAGAGDARDGSEELAAGLGRLSDGASTLASGTGQAATGAGSLAAGTSALASGTVSLAAGASKLNDGAGALASGLAALQSGTTSLSVSAKALAAGAAQVDAGVADAGSKIEEAASGAGSVSTGATGVTQLLAAVAAKYPDAAADPLFKQASATASAVASGSATLAVSLSDSTVSATGLSAGAHQVALGTRLLAEGATKLSTATAQAAAGARALSDGASEVSSGSTGLATGADSLDTGAHEAVAGVAKLAAGSRALARNLTKADTGAHTLTAGLGDLHGGAADLVDGLADAASGSHDLADGLAEGAEDVPAYSEVDRTARAEMMGDPVALDQTKFGAVKTYGTGFAPYFVPLALWVGMLIVFVLLAPIPERAVRSGAKAPVIAMTGMWPAIVIGLGQSILMYVVLRFSLGLDPVSPLATFGLILLTSIVYAAVMQWLSAAFGPVGKLMGIIILMLQLTSAAGTFPLETLPSFFRAISPWMPMTHAVAALRESISGGDVAAMAREAWLLALFGVAAFTGTVFSARKAHLWSSKRLKPTIDL